MEHRQHVEHLVLAAEIDAGGGLGGVRQHVAVGEHDALGHALRARREQDGGPVVGLALDQRLLGVEQAADLVGERDGGADVLEIDDPDRLLERRNQIGELAAFDEDARRDDGGELRGLAGGQDVGGAGGEVDHRRHAAGRHQAEHGDDRAVGVRQHHADGAPFGRERHQFGAEDRGARQQALVAERAGHRVLDRDRLAAVQARGVDHRLEHGAVGRGGAEHEIRHDAVERGARRQPALAALELGIDRELDRLEDRDLDLREPLAAHLPLGQPAERRLLQALDAHRHDLGIGLVGDHGGAVVDLHQAAGDGDAPFRKDDQRVAGLDRVDQGANRHRLQRIERHRVGELHERPHPPQLGDADIDGEDRLAVAQRQRQAGVEEAHVVERDDDVGAGLGEIVEALHLDPEQRAIEDRERIAERARRHGAADGDRDQRGCRRRAGGTGSTSSCRRPAAARRAARCRS